MRVPSQTLSWKTPWPYGVGWRESMPSVFLTPKGVSEGTFSERFSGLLPFREKPDPELW